MLFLFRGKNGPAARDVIGVLLVACGFAVHGDAILAGVGAVLLVCGRARAPGRTGSASRPRSSAAGCHERYCRSTRLTKRFGDFAAVSSTA